jgi:hypothetical protein
MLAKPTSLPPTSDCISLLIDPGKECGSAKDNFNIISLDLLFMKAMIPSNFHSSFLFFRLRLGSNNRLNKWASPSPPLRSYLSPQFEL